MNRLIQAIKDLAQTIANTLEAAFEWLTDRAYRVAAYFTIVTLLMIATLILDFSWFWLIFAVFNAAFGTFLTVYAAREERDMVARVEEALAEVDFNDTSRWIGSEDEGYPKRPER
jgi:hypothetical protein